MATTSRPSRGSDRVLGSRPRPSGSRHARRPRPSCRCRSGRGRSSGWRRLVGRVDAAAPAGEHDRADRRDQQQERRDLERRAGTWSAAARRSAPGVPKPGSYCAPSRVDRLQARAEHRDHELDEQRGGEHDGADVQRRPPAGRIGICVAADVGDDEHVEHHHRAGVDDDLRGGDELRAQQQEQRRQRQQVEDQRRAPRRRGCATGTTPIAPAMAPMPAMKKRTSAMWSGRRLFALGAQRRALQRLGEQHLLGEDQVGAVVVATSRSRGPS